MTLEDLLNKVKNKAHYEKTKRSIEEITNTEVIGGIIRDDNISIEQRHLGLVPARERENSLKFIDLWSEVIKNSIDYNKYIPLPNNKGINIFKGLFSFILVMFSKDGLSLFMLCLFLLIISSFILVLLYN